MKIPNEIIAKLSADQELLGLTTSSASNISQLVSASRMVFFPEYTDHGTDHLEAVALTAWDIAKEASLELLGSEDAAVLSLAVGLHDLGMHLSRDSFESLIAPHSNWVGIPGIDQTTWAELWNTFVAEASRFDGRTLQSIFGDSSKPSRLPPSGDWEDRDYLLVGEFLRRYHHRLAHEIARYGFPGKSGNFIQVIPATSDRTAELADLAGLVARSHGMNIRDTFQYLRDKYTNIVDPRRSRVVFLMVLLRVADYFQIQPSRAPIARTSVTTLRSPVSRNEWKVHQSIKDITNTGSDPEAIIINANPDNVETFLRLKSWLTGLQHELDTSWAVLGEVFGLQKNHLSELGLRVRRIKSNIDDIQTFSKNVTYVPDRIAFETANADLLKLLVGPLYGNDVGAGFRELFQNSVDAIKERQAAAIREPKMAFPPGIEGELVLSVVLAKDGFPEKVVVSDNGIGMTLDILKNYFLRAGASFRKSDSWKKDFENADGHSSVLRSGRFGVGALAAFLLGDEIEVITRHAASPPEDAFHFRAKVDDSAINITRITAEVGTTITVFVSPSKREEIKQAVSSSSGDVGYESKIGQYFGVVPNIKRIVGNIVRKSTKTRSIPSDEGSNNWPWRCTRVESVILYWNYTRGPHLVCNGIVVDVGKAYGEPDLKLDSPLMTPRIAVLDPDGVVELNLQRNKANLTPYRDAITQSIVDDLICHALLNAPVTAESNWFTEGYQGFRTSSHGFGLQRMARWALTGSGFFPAVEEIIAAECGSLVLVGTGGQSGFLGWGTAAKNIMPAGTIFLACQPMSFEGGGSRVKGVLRDALTSPIRIPGFTYAPSIAAYSNAALQTVQRYSPGRDLNAILAASQESGVPNWRLFGRGPQSDDDLMCSIIRNVDGSTTNMAFSISRRTQTTGRTVATSSILARRWAEILGENTIPFDLAHRDSLKARARRLIPDTMGINESELLTREVARLAKLNSPSPPPTHPTPSPATA